MPLAFSDHEGFSPDDDGDQSRPHRDGREFPGIVQYRWSGGLSHREHLLDSVAVSRNRSTETLKRLPTHARKPSPHPCADGGAARGRPRPLVLAVRTAAAREGGGPGLRAPCFRHHFCLMAVGTGKVASDAVGGTAVPREQRNEARGRPSVLARRELSRRSSSDAMVMAEGRCVPLCLLHDLRVTRRVSVYRSVLSLPWVPVA